MFCFKHTCTHVDMYVCMFVCACVCAYRYAHTPKPKTLNPKALRLREEGGDPHGGFPKIGDPNIVP